MSSRMISASFWLPIGDVAAWDAAQKIELDRVMKGRSGPH